MHITRDKAELGDGPFITFTVYRTPRDNTTICGFHEFSDQASGNSFRFHKTPLGIPVVQAFEETCRFAESEGISTIWIDDPSHLFETGQSR